MKFLKAIWNWFIPSKNAASAFCPRGRFEVEHIRDGKVIGKYAMPNGVVDVGLNEILNVMFHGTSPVDPWYIALINNAGFTAFSAADTMASHAGWVETSSYDEATRPEWTEGAAAARSITNSVTVDFTISATLTIKGIFITSANDKGGATGILWATAAFGSLVSVVDNDVLKVTYTVSG